MSVVIKDKMPIFKKSLYNVLDDAIREAGKDTLIAAKERAPFRKGPLRAQSIVDKVKSLHYRVSFWMEYARFQEVGGDSKRRVKHYTSPGTGSKYLKTSGDNQAKKLQITIKKHTKRARA